MKNEFYKNISKNETIFLRQQNKTPGRSHTVRLI